MLKKCFLLIGLVLFCLSVGKGIHWARDGFNIRRIQGWDQGFVATWDEGVDQILSQDFYYFSRGRQCFAFVNATGDYVLKFPRTDTQRFPLWARTLSLKSYRDWFLKRRFSRKQGLMDSFRISFEELREQTGILAIHLGRSPPEGKFLTLVDRIGYRTRLPLEKASFVLQSRHSLLVPQLLEAFRTGDEQAKVSMLSAFVDIVVERARKGILNRDEGFEKNYAFDGGHAFQIDVGSFHREETMQPEQAFRKSVWDTVQPFKEWLAEVDPDALKIFNQKLEEVCPNFF